MEELPPVIGTLHGRSVPSALETPPSSRRGKAPPLDLALHAEAKRLRRVSCSGNTLRSVENLRSSLTISVACTGATGFDVLQPSGKSLPRHAALSKRRKTRLCERGWADGRAQKRLRENVEADLCDCANQLLALQPSRREKQVYQKCQLPKG